MELDEGQKRELRIIWFVFGNEGKLHTHDNHRFIQNLLEYGEDSREFYLSSPKNDLSEECIKAVDQILLLWKTGNE